MYDKKCNRTGTGHLLPKHQDQADDKGSEEMHSRKEIKE
jgi:hypothetical protein